MMNSKKFMFIIKKSDENLFVATIGFEVIPSADMMPKGIDAPKKL